MNQGIIVRSCEYTVREMMNHLIVFLQQQGLTVYARINQQEEVRRLGMEIRPMELVLFARPLSSGLMVQENPVAAMEIPQRILVWEDVGGRRWVAYSDPGYLCARFGLSEAVGVSQEVGGMVEQVLNLKG